MTWILVDLGKWSSLMHGRYAWAAFVDEDRNGDTTWSCPAYGVGFIRSRYMDRYVLERVVL